MAKTKEKRFRSISDRFQVAAVFRNLFQVMRGISHCVASCPQGTDDRSPPPLASKTHTPTETGGISGHFFEKKQKMNSMTS